MASYELLDQLKGPGGAVCTEQYEAKDYADGRILAIRPGGKWAEENFGFVW